MAVLTPRAISESVASGGDRIEGSFSFKGPDRNYELNRTPSVNTSSEKLTVSLWWYPTSTIGGTANPANKGIMIGGGGDGSYSLLQFYNRALYWGNEADWVMTQGDLNDNSWMHIVLIADSTLADTASRMQIWVNGVQQILNTSTLYDQPGQNDNFPLLNNNDKHYIGKRSANDMNADGHLSQFYFIDGEAVAATEFGYEDPLTGIWKPKKYTGDYNYTKYDTTNATGGNTILNTNDSGSTIESGYRTDSSAGTTANQGLVLAWPGNVVNGDVHDHINTGSSAKTVAAESDAEISTTQSNFYGSSGYINKTDDCFRVTDHADLALGSGDYTVEMWHYPTELFNNAIIYDGRHPTSGWPTSGGGFALITNANGQVSTYTAGAYTAQTGNYAIAVNTWNHIAVVRNSGTQKIYINGKEKASASNSTNHTEEKAVLGAGANSGEACAGYFNDWRIYKATAKYTSEFIPPKFSIGGNSFYLPFDGSAPLGRDQSGIGNDWNVEGGGNSVTEDRATGAIPILNTVNSGGSAVPGVRGEVGIAVTVYNDGGGNKYYLDGQQAGTVNFIPGQTVKFDTSDSTCSGHPFRISTVSDGAHAADYYGVDFDGTGDYLSIPDNADFNYGSGDFTLECWVNPNVAGTHQKLITAQTTGGANHGPCNLYFTNGLLQFWSSSNNSSPDIAGGIGIGVPPAGEWSHIAVSREGTSIRLFFNGVNTNTVTSSAAVMDATGDFNIGGRNNGSDLFNGLISDFRIVKGTAVYTSNFTPPTEPLTAITNTKLLCCNSSTTTGSTVTPDTITAAGDPTASNTNPYDSYVYGNIAAGTAGADSTGVDFDGDDKITISQSSSEFSLQSDFTIEGWVKCDAFTTDCAAFSCWRTTSGSERNLIIGPNASGSNKWVFMYNTGGGGGDWVTVANPDAWTGEWVHLAYSYTHSGTTHRAFLNGTLVGTNSGSAIHNDASAPFLLGVNVDNGSGYFDGKMWNVRFSNSVRYTDSFTPQRTPFATDGNTVFLGCLDSSSATTAVTNTAGSITGGGNPSVYTIVEDTLTPSTKITVPHNAPSDLYYYCTNHSGMGGSIKIGASDPLKADPYASSCHFAWPCTDIYDVSDKVNCKSLKKGLTITNSVATSETRTNFYGRSYYSSGTDPRVHTNPFQDLAARTGDFTYELWFWWDDQGSNATVGASRDSGNTANGWSTDIIDTHYIQMWCDDANNATATNTIQQSEWNHFACVRKNGTMKFYINGVEQSSESVANDFSVFENGLNLGTVPTGSNDFQGYYSDVRYYNGVAKYDGEFFPASCHPNVTPESPTGVTWDSPRPDKLESDGSAYFDGDGDYLDIATVDTAFGTGTDWTMEMWICPHEVDTTAITDPRTSDSSVHPLLWISGGNGGKPTGVLYYYTAGADKIVGRTVLVPHRWYHAAVVRYNNITTLYLDGKYEGSFADSEDYVTATNFRIGGRYTGTLYEFEGYISNFRLVNGTAVYTQEFIPPKKALTNITNTKLLCLQTKNSVTQALGDSGSLTRASQLGPSDYNPFNYTGASLRPMNYAIVRDNGPKGLYRTLVDSSGLKVQTSSGSPGGGLWTSSIPMKTGKWYAEIRCTAHSSVHMMIGICKADGIDCNVQINESSLEPGWGIGHISGDGSYRRICWGANWGSSQNGVEDWAETWGTGDYMGIMLNCDDKIMSFFKNGKNMGNSESGFQRDPDWGSLMDGKDGISSADIGSGMVFCGGNGQASTTSDWELNFGQRPWKYPPRMDDRRGGASYQHLGEYYAASMQNTYERTPVLNPKKEAHNTALWNGNGSSQMINVGFQPDLVAIKKRSGGTNRSWQWYDSVRGKYWLLHSDGGLNQTGDEQEQTAGLTDFNSDGFSVGSDDGVNGSSSSPKYAAWCWKAGGNKGTWNVNGEDRGSAAAAGLTAGDTSVLTGCSINTKTGFGIVSWTQDSGGASKSIAHGLTEAPAFVIMKQLNVGSNSNFFVYHKRVTSAAKLLYLNGAEAEDTSSDFGNTAPSSTVITTSTTGVDGRKVIMWYWANIPGVQKFDVYEGNNDSDNQYVHLGFRPAILWVKKRDGYYSWFCYDDRRGENYNPRNDVYHPNDSAAEYSGSDYNIDFLPEGFKVRSSHASCGAAEPYIYCAWAATAGFSQYSGATRLGSGRTEGSDS